ncbi:MAG: hypothetical protein KatS3mg111_3259 [Pirellulaceae bacterium]|nr:MAG: hypothetical protein KatS3mg111_3259 [Pirellulaceae bacterium]
MSEANRVLPGEGRSPAATTTSSLAWMMLGMLIAALALVAGAAHFWWRELLSVSAAVEQTDSAPQPFSWLPPARAVDLDALVTAPTADMPTTTAALFDEINGHIEKLCGRFPESPDCLEIKARVCDWQGKTEQAIEVWRRCLEIDPQYLHAHVGLATVALRLDDIDAALEHAKTAMEIAPREFLPRDLLAQALINQQQPREVLNVLEEYLESDPRSHGFFLVGQAYVQLDEFELAKIAFEKAISKFPEYADAHYALSRALIRLGERDEAQEHVQIYSRLIAKERADRNSPSGDRDDFPETRRQGATFLTDIGRIYLAVGEPMRAEWYWRRAIALAPSHVAARELLVSASLKEKRLWEAAHWLDELGRLKKDDPRPWLHAAQLFAEGLIFEDAER